MRTTRPDRQRRIFASAYLALSGASLIGAFVLALCGVGNVGWFVSASLVMAVWGSIVATSETITVADCLPFLSLFHRVDGSTRPEKQAPLPIGRSRSDDLPNKTVNQSRQSDGF